MDFSSIPAYLDPSNWQQTPPPPPPQQQQQQHHQQNHHHGSSSNNIIINPNNPLLPPPPLPPPLQMPAPPPPPPMGGLGGSIRPGSMAERARMANIPMPEAALKCPRCESLNTKFCYFNNYNLSQPRHFCKTCRRYWTRGGALRNVPVGGGCRRNKRSKSSSGGASSSKSAGGGGDRSSSAAATSSASSALSGGGSGGMADMLGLTPPPLSALRFMNSTPLHHLTSDFGGGGLGLSNYGGIPPTGDLGFQLGNNIGMEQWRMPAPPPPQFPFFSGLDGAAGAGGSRIYGHQFEEMELSSLGIGHHMASKGMETSSSVKMEESGGRREMSSANLARQFNLGNAAGEHYNWGGVGGGGGGGGGSSSSGNNAWTDISGLNNNSSCSTTSAL